MQGAHRHTGGIGRARAGVEQWVWGRQAELGRAWIASDPFTGGTGAKASLAGISLPLSKLRCSYFVLITKTLFLIEPLVSLPFNNKIKYNNYIRLHHCYIYIYVYLFMLVCYLFVYTAWKKFTLTVHIFPSRALNVLQICSTSLIYVVYSRHISNGWNDSWCQYCKLGVLFRT